MHKIASYPRL